MTALIIILAVLATAGWLMVWGAAITFRREREEKEKLQQANTEWQLENEVLREQLCQALHDADTATAWECYETITREEA